MIATMGRSHSFAGQFVPNIAIASRGPVLSVTLFSRVRAPISGETPRNTVGFERGEEEGRKRTQQDAARFGGEV
jgi:hypothetical protein